MSKVLKKPVVFHIMGVPGSGKSWHSRQLSKQLSAVHIDTERIRFELFENQSYSEDEEVVVENMTDYFVQSVLRSKMNVVIDGGSNSRKRRKEIARIAEKNEYEYVLVWLQSNDDLCKVRATSSENTSVDEYKRKLGSDEFNDICSKLEKPTEKEEPVVVSGSHSFRAQLKSIVTKLNSRSLLSMSASAKSGSSESKTKDAETRRNTQRVSG